MSDGAGIDPEAEREVDLRSLWSRVVERWWLPVGGLLIGGVLGILVSLGGSSVYEAKGLLYLGQPFTPNGGGQIQSLQTNPKTVSEIVRSEAAIRRAAAVSGMNPGQLRGNVTTQSVVSPGQGAKSTSPLQEIIVQAPTRAKANAAAASFSRSVIAAVSPYVNRKVSLLEKQIAADTGALDSANIRISSALEQQAAAIKNEKLSLAERILIQSNVNSTLQFYEARTTNLRADLNDAEQLLSLAKEVEQSHIVEPAHAVKTSAKGARNAAVVGGLIGLLLGALAAVVADAALRRRAGAETG